MGTILVDGQGRTVYAFTNDTKDASACTGICDQNWPFVPAPSPLPASLPGVTGAVGQITRPDGRQQLTINGHLIYTFAGDSAPGQTNGQGEVFRGGLWSVVSPAGDPVGNAAAGTSVTD